MFDLTNTLIVLLETSMGISIDAQKRRVVFDRPYLPQGVPQLTINDLRVEDCRIGLFLERDSGPVRVQVNEKHGEIAVVVK